MESITVTYTAEEASIQLKLNDLAVRHGGLEVAEAAVVLSHKIRNAAKDAMPAGKSNGVGEAFGKEVPGPPGA